MKLFTVFLLPALLLGSLALNAHEQVESSPDVYEIEGVLIPSGDTVDGRRFDVESMSTEVRPSLSVLVDHVNKVSVVIGKVTALYKEDGALKFKAVLIADTQLSADVIKRVQSGALRAVSCGIASEIRHQKDEDTPDGGVVKVFYKAKVQEISIVAISAYEGAEIKSIKIKD